jgi:hypothetical protein
MQGLILIFQGKYTYYTREMKHTHLILQPSKIFKEDSNLGFRDVGLQMIKQIKEVWAC